MLESFLPSEKRTEVNIMGGYDCTETESARIARGGKYYADDNWETCQDCNGSGEAQDSTRCPNCRGKGEVMAIISNPEGS